jgi:catechol 2,3-dioxygenase-like lactoylglutathione lyase family enzyme
VRSEAVGRVIHLRDPEGNLISLLDSPAGASGSGNSSPAAAVSKPARSGAKAAATALATDRARFSTVIVNCADVAATKAFYRDRLGLKLEIDSPSWVSFPVGGVTLALHPRIETPATESHHEGDVTLGFMVSDLIAWADEARDRGVHFTSAPEDEDFGMFADTADPDGNEITFREPLAEPALEEKLAEEFEDDEVPHQVAIRKTVKKGVKAVSRVAVRPEYQSETAPKRKVAKKPASRSTRGAGAAGSRLKPKRAADTKRARTRPATGRLKKAERRTLNTKKLAVAGSSKSKPVKHASAGARKSSPKKRALAARGRKH